MILFGAVMGGICCFLMPFAGSLTAMIIIWAANGFFQSMLWSPILRIYSEMINKKLKKRAILDISLSLPVGTVCAYLASTLIIKYFKWHYVFVCGSICIFLAALFVFQFIFIPKRILLKEEYALLKLRIKMMITANGAFFSCTGQRAVYYYDTVIPARNDA